jgi:hypothetical protein
MTNWSIKNRIRAGMIMAVLLVAAIAQLPLRAQEAPAPAKMPDAPPAPAKDADDEVDSINPGDEQVSADNNLSFPVDI